MPTGHGSPINPDTYIPNFSSDAKQAVDHFLVCGLGSLGQQTIVNLKKFSSEPFEVKITAIDRQPSHDWEVENLPSLLAEPPVVGDCRRDAVLLKAGIERCRAVLIVTSDESVNVETAIATRRLNPNVQIILRSSRHSLNALLQQQLGRFVALDATELPATTFALAGLDDDSISIFRIKDYQFRIIERYVRANEPHFDDMPLHRLHRRHSRLLNLKPQTKRSQPIGWATTASSTFHRWQPHVRVHAGDEIAYIEVDQPNVVKQPRPAARPLPYQKLRRWLEDVFDGNWRRQFLNFWQQDTYESLRRVTLIAVLTGLFLWTTAVLVLQFAVTGVSWNEALFLGAILILGGYGDAFGYLTDNNADSWVMTVCLLISITSILMVLGIFGLLADQLLSSRFEFLRRRPRLPKRNHVIVVGLGRVGNRVVRILQDLKQPLVVVTNELQYPELLNEVPLMVGHILSELKATNLETAKSVIAVTDDLMLNLEVALVASKVFEEKNKPFSPVIRTLTQTFSDNLAALMPQAKAFSAYALSAEAFAGAAFGENILGLFRLNEQTILVAEYLVEADDTLHGRLLAEVSYGYGVVPILLQNRNIQAEGKDILMPDDNVKLSVGDHLYVLSSINGLRRIERGDRTEPRRWSLSADMPLNKDVLLEAGNRLAQLSGISLPRCRQFMESLPCEIDLKLYDYQAYRLMQELNRRLPIRLSPLESAAKTHL
ncbi:MAG: NAD-binding protein [Cyanobacteria bacterium P01_D01_bin.14]